MVLIPSIFLFTLFTVYSLGFLASIVIFIFFINIIGLIAHGAIPNNTDYNDANNLSVDSKHTDNGTHPMGGGFHAMTTMEALSISYRNKDCELANNPSRGKYHYSNVVCWAKNTYYLLVAKSRIDSTRLFLLSAGPVGLIGIRRRFK